MATELKIGDTAPDFCLPDKDGNNVCKKDFEGKYFVLYFYPKDNTSGCTLEAKDFSENIDEFSSKDVTVIGVSPDSCSSHQKFISKYDLNYISSKQGRSLYRLEMVPEKAGTFFYGLRLYPRSEDLPHRQDFYLLKWID